MRRPLVLAVVLAIVLGLAAYAWFRNTRQAAPEAPAAVPGGSSDPAAAAPADAPVILAIGDSLTDGYGVPRSQSYPAQLEAALAQRGFPHRVVNAGVSGDTTGGGLSRLPALLERHRPEVVVIEFGANDAFRGVPIDEVYNNLEQMVGLSEQAGARVVLAGMETVTNLGPDYTAAFRQVYTRLAGAHDGVALIPWFLDGVAMSVSLNLEDGIHPTAEGYGMIVEQNVLPVLIPVLEQ